MLLLVIIIQNYDVHHNTYIIWTYGIHANAYLTMM